MPILTPPGRLQVERLPNGRPQLLRELQYALVSVGQKTPSGGWELPGNPPRSWA